MNDKTFYGKYWDLRRDEVTGEWRSFIICCHPQISLGRLKQGR
jgi:hypothetical protein